MQIHVALRQRGWSRRTRDLSHVEFLRTSQNARFWLAWSTPLSHGVLYTSYRSPRLSTLLRGGSYVLNACAVRWLVWRAANTGRPSIHGTARCPQTDLVQIIYRLVFFAERRDSSHPITDIVIFPRKKQRDVAAGDVNTIRQRSLMFYSVGRSAVIGR